jgi:hypothetical protein
MYAAPCFNANGPDRLRFTPTATTFIAATAVLNAVLYHLPLFSFAAANLDLSSVTGDLTLATLLVVLLSETVLLLTLPALISIRLLKPFCMVIAMGNRSLCILWSPTTSCSTKR